jgi:hypothetical protein
LDTMRDRSVPSRHALDRAGRETMHPCRPAGCRTSTKRNSVQIGAALWQRGALRPARSPLRPGHADRSGASRLAWSSEHQGVWRAIATLRDAMLVRRQAECGSRSNPVCPRMAWDAWREHAATMTQAAARARHDSKE